MAEGGHFIRPPALAINILTGDVEIWFFYADTFSFPLDRMVDSVVHELIHALITGRNKEEETVHLTNEAIGKKEYHFVDKA